MKKFIFLIAATMATASCTITKRHYAPGYHVDFWSKYDPISCPTDNIQKGIDSESESDSELQSMADLKSDIISLPINNEMQFKSEMRSVFGSQIEKDSILSLYTESNVIKDTLPPPQSTEDFIKPKEKVNSKAAIGFGLSVLGVLSGFFAPAFVFYFTCIGVLLSYLGYKEIKRHGGRGENLAKWGMGIPLALLALFIVGAFLFLAIYGLSLS